MQRLKKKIEELINELRREVKLISTRGLTKNLINIVFLTEQHSLLKIDHKIV